MSNSDERGKNSHKHDLEVTGKTWNELHISATKLYLIPITGFPQIADYTLWIFVINNGIY